MSLEKSLKAKPQPLCRRDRPRFKVVPSRVACWSPCDEVETVSAIEADSRGARLMLPWNVQPGEELTVSVGDDLGHYQTQHAYVVWTQRLEVSGRVIAGVCFEEELSIAV